MPEQEIIDGIRRQDEDGMEQFLRRYGPLMRYVIAPILPNEQDQEECVSEAALRVWTSIDRFHPQKGSWTAWVTAICRNAALNRRRSQRNMTEGIPDETPDPKPTPEEALLNKERQERLLRALRGVSKRDRALFYRKYYYLQSTAQIAAELGLTERAVEGRLYRLRKKLQAELGGDGDA